MPTPAILKREILIAVLLRLIEGASKYPLFQFFPREQYDGDELIVRIREIVGQIYNYTTIDGNAVQVAPETLSSITMEPVYAKLIDSVAPSDVALFAEWDEIIMKAGPSSEGVPAKLARKVSRLVERVSIPGFVMLHDMLSSALRGQFQFNLGGTTVTTNYGLTTLASPALTWTDAAATIVTDIYDMIEEFTGNANGVPPDTVFYNPSVWADYFVRNTEFRTFVVAVPELAKDFGGMAGGQRIADGQGVFVDKMFHLMWVPIRGTHIKGGATELRWPVDILTFAALRADSERVLEHAMVKDQYNPAANWNIESFEKKEPKSTKVRFADNGAAALLLPERIQPTLTLEPAP